MLGYAGIPQIIDTLVASSSSAAAPADKDPVSARPDSSSQQLQQLQRQVAQTAAAAGVLVEQVVIDDVQSEPSHLAESCQDALQRLQQLQQDAVPLAERLKASM